MSIKNREGSILCSFDHSEGPHCFTGIRELGFNSRGTFIVNTYTTPAVPHGPRGTFITAIPISPLDYRRKNKTKASYERRRNQIVIYDDWGRRHYIEAPRAVLDILEDECEANEIPRKAI